MSTDEQQDYPLIADGETTARLEAVAEGMDTAKLTEYARSLGVEPPVEHWQLVVGLNADFEFDGLYWTGPDVPGRVG